MQDLTDYIKQMLNSHLSKIQVDVELKDGIYYIITNDVKINTRYANRQIFARELIIDTLKQYLPEGFINYKIIVNR